MWPRIVEILLGIWLVASPWIFRSAETGTLGSANDLICGVLAICLALASFSDRLRRAHFLILVLAAWLAITGYITGHPAPPAAQNLIIIGILLAMFAIIPGRINEMPGSSRRFYSEKG